MIPKLIHIISIPEHKEVLLLKNSYPSNNLIKKSNITVMTWDKKMIHPLLEKYPKIYFILGHFSMRYTDSELTEINTKIQEEYSNVMLFI